MNRIEAQRRSDAIAAFEAELKRLDAAGVLELTPAQREAVAGYHRELLAGFQRDFDIDRTTASRQLSWGLRIASLVGALALAASVFFLFYQFWGLLGTTPQVVVLLAAALGSLGLTVWIARLDGRGYFSKLAAMVAFACFVLNVAMLGPIFNITPSENALLVWSVYAALLAYALDQRLLLAAAIVCLAGFISARTGTWMGGYWLSFGQHPESFFPAALLLFLIPWRFEHRNDPTFAAIYRVFALLLLFLPMLVLSNWGYGSYLTWDPDFIEGMYQVAGFALSALVIWLGIGRQWNDTVNTGVVFFVLLLYTKFFDWWWDWLPKYVFFLLIGLIAVLLMLVLKRLRQRLLPDGNGTNG